MRRLYGCYFFFVGFVFYVEVFSLIFVSEWDFMLFDIMSVDVRFVFFDGEFFEVYRIVFVVVFFIFKNVFSEKCL